LLVTSAIYNGELATGKKITHIATADVLGYFIILLFIWVTLNKSIKSKALLFLKIYS